MISPGDLVYIPHRDGAVVSDYYGVVIKVCRAPGETFDRVLLTLTRDDLETRRFLGEVRFPRASDVRVLAGCMVRRPMMEG